MSKAPTTRCYPWLRSNTLTISAGNSYDIKIPTGKFAKTHGKMRSL